MFQVTQQTLLNHPDLSFLCGTGEDPKIRYVDPLGATNPLSYDPLGVSNPLNYRNYGDLFRQHDDKDVDHLIPWYYHLCPDRRLSWNEHQTSCYQHKARILADNEN